MKLKYFWQWQGKLEAMPGSRMGEELIAEAVRIARDLRRPFTFTFNDEQITVDHTSPVDLIYRDWQRAVAGCIESVGPNPKPHLSKRELDADEVVYARNEARRTAAHRAYQQETAEKRARLESRITGITLEIINRDIWDKVSAANTDGYGRGIMEYAELWGRLMQGELATGKPLEEIAEQTSRDADVVGLSGFMYGAAVGLLANTWVHGETLRRWHNLKTQIHDEGERANESGGVLNPALLRIGGAA